MNPIKTRDKIGPKVKARNITDFSNKAMNTRAVRTNSKDGSSKGKTNKDVNNKGKTSKDASSKDKIIKDASKGKSSKADADAADPAAEAVAQAAMIARRVSCFTCISLFHLATNAHARTPA